VIEKVDNYTPTKNKISVPFAEKKIEPIVRSFNTMKNRFFLNNSPVNALMYFCVFLLVISFLKNLFFYLQRIFASMFSQSIVNDIRKEVFAHLHSLSLNFFHKNKVGNLISRITFDVQKMQQTLTVGFVDLVRIPIQVVMFYLYLLAINWRLTVYITLIAPVIIYVLSFVGRLLRRYGKRSQERMAMINILLQENFSGIRLIKGFGKDEFEIKRFNDRANSFLKAQLKMIKISRAGSPLNEMIATVAATFVLWFGGKDVLLLGEPEPATFLQYIAVLLLLADPLRKISEHYSHLQEGMAAAERVFETLDTKSDMIFPENGKKYDHLENRIEFKNVSFKYDEADSYALKNINLTIKKCETIALVGRSGAGKSTIADLIIRFYDPNEGEILFDGTNVRDFDINSLRNKMGIVTQETILFNESVAYNIAYGDTNPDRERIVEAAEAANAWEFISNMPNNIDTIIGDRGVKISGGERQRISIARAIYRNPDILIFDEATSALDTESEKLVQSAIDRLLNNRTAIVIAHRLSTIAKAHQILVVDRGSIAEQGTHQELLDKNGLYKELYDKQFES